MPKMRFESCKMECSIQISARAFKRIFFWFQDSASIQPRTSPLNFARSPCENIQFASICLSLPQFVSIYPISINLHHLSYNLHQFTPICINLPTFASICPNLHQPLNVHQDLLLLLSNVIERQINIFLRKFIQPFIEHFFGFLA